MYPSSSPTKATILGMEKDNRSGSGQRKVDGPVPLHTQSLDVSSKLNSTYDSQESDDDALGDMIYQSSRTRKNRAAEEEAKEEGKAEEQESNYVNWSSLEAEFTANSTTSATSDGIIHNIKVPGIHDGEGVEVFPSGRGEKSNKIREIENNRRRCKTTEGCTNQARVGEVNVATKRKYCSHEGSYTNSSKSVDVLTKLLGDVTRSMILDRKLIESARGKVKLLEESLETEKGKVKLLEESLETGKGLEHRLGLQLELAKSESRVRDTLTQSYWDSRTHTPSIQQSHNTLSNNINRWAPLVQQQLPCPIYTQAPIANKKQVSKNNVLLSDSGKSKSNSPSSQEKTCEAQIGKNHNLTFPFVLYNLLEYASSDYSSSISWSEKGKSFIIHNREEFMAHVAPIFFPKQSSYRSFTRQLNKWGFTCLHHFWAHEDFIRGQTGRLACIVERSIFKLSR